MEQDTEQTPYDLQVRRIAKILAKENFPSRYERKYRLPGLWETAVDRFQPSAKLIVAEIEKEVRLAYAPTVGMLTTEAYLKQRGLIPPTKSHNNG